MNHKLRIDLFGRVTLSYRRQTTSVFVTSKVRDLLALLVVRRGERCDRDQLIRQIWSEQSGTNDRNRLSVTLYHLRQALEGLGCESQNFVKADRNSVWLVEDVVEADLWDLQEAFDQGMQSDQADVKRLRFQSVFDLYQGPIQAAHMTTAMDQWRSLSLTMYATATEWLCQDLVDQGKQAEAVGRLTSALARSGEDEAMLKAAIRLYDQWEDGQRVSELLRHLVKVYRDRNIEPDQGTRSFVREMRTKYLGSDGRSMRQTARPMTAVIVEGVEAAVLDRIATKHGVNGDRGDGFVLTRNPLVATDIAREVLREGADARIVLHTIIPKS